MQTLILPPFAAQVGLAVDIAAFAMHQGELQVLLVRRGLEPHSQSWALPGGFVHHDETLAAAALRELREETNVSLNPNHLEQFFTFGNPGRDPRGRVVSVAHMAVLPHGALEVVAGGNTVGAGWFAAHAAPALAFDHSNILERAIRRLQLRLEYANLAFEFLPEQFTLPELQEVYEAILNNKLDKRNFRKKLLSLNLLEQAGERRSGVGRPAQVYKCTRKVKFPTGL